MKTKKEKQTLSKEYIKKSIGWCYHQIRTLDDHTAQIYNQQREGYERFFEENGVQSPNGNKLKLFINKLSPGCQTCIDGSWSCIYINHLCSRNCFYCQKDPKIRIEKNPRSSLINFDAVEDYIGHLKKYNFRGIGFSGGEPFMVFERLCEYIKRIRAEFGDKHYIWVYTNGDYVVDEKMQHLCSSGLNEIRFNLSARGYDLSPVQIALRHIQTVTVEIPAIPEDVERVKQMMHQLDDMGVSFLNIHQLTMNKFNYHELIKRNYTLLHHRLYPILESELVGFELLKYAIEYKLRMGFNYCSACYKDVFHGRAFQKKYCSEVINKYESMTATGLIRRIKLTIPSDARSNVMALDYKTIKTPRYEGGYLLVSQNEFCELLDNDSEIMLPVIVEYQTVKGPPLTNNLEQRRLTNEELTLHDQSSIWFFRKLFIEGKPKSEAANEILALYKLNNESLHRVCNDIDRFFAAFLNLEYLNSNMTEYF